MPNVAMSDCRSMLDFQDATMWRVRITKPPQGVTIPADFSLRCKSSSIPKREANQVSEVTLHRQKRRVPGIEHTAGSLELTIVETVDNATKLMIQAMREKNRTQERAHADTFANSTGTWELIMMDRQGNDIYSYTLLEVFIEDHDYGTPLSDGEATTYFTDMTMTLAYSHFTEVAV